MDTIPQTIKPGDPVPTTINGWPAQPFIVPKENGRV